MMRFWSGTQNAFSSNLRTTSRMRVGLISTCFPADQWDRSGCPSHEESSRPGCRCHVLSALQESGSLPFAQELDDLLQIGVLLFRELFNWRGARSELQSRILKLRILHLEQAGQGHELLFGHLEESRNLVHGADCRLITLLRLDLQQLHQIDIHLFSELFERDPSLPPGKLHKAHKGMLHREDVARLLAGFFERLNKPSHGDVAPILHRYINRLGSQVPGDTEAF